MPEPQTVPEPQPQPQAPACRCPSSRLVPGLILGLIIGNLLGCVIGARYLYWNHNIQIPLSLLPPHVRNFADIYAQSLPIGATKQQVIEKLGVEQVTVLSGDLNDEAWRWADGSTTPGKRPPAGTVEVWLIPQMNAGLSEFMSLCFDANQKLIYKSSGDWMLGYPKNPYNYSEIDKTRRHGQE
ncbi:hypothetical protein LLG95_06830 [bacterium]|nr:hypothetical protein [bacterium]